MKEHVSIPMMLSITGFSPDDIKTCLENIQTRYAKLINAPVSGLNRDGRNTARSYRMFMMHLYDNLNDAKSLRNYMMIYCGHCDLVQAQNIQGFLKDISLDDALCPTSLPDFTTPITITNERIDEDV